jgi:Ras-related protein Rab-1A
MKCNEEIIYVKDINEQEKKINTFIKCLMIGSTGVGKSSILERYVSNNFYEHFITTIGVDYKFKDVDIDNYKVKLQLWDTASQERFRCITSNYYRNSHIIIVCYDITDKHSFGELDYWINDAKKFLVENVLIAICGTKMDLNFKRTITFEEAKNYADYNNMYYFEISSKNGEGLQNMFNNLIKIKLSEPEFIKIDIKPENIFEKFEVLKVNENNYNTYNYDSCCQYMN